MAHQDAGRTRVRAFDTTGDGYVDAFDTTGDGRPDQFDTTGDGYVDAFDTNGDGTPDAFDTNGDGTVDTVKSAAAARRARVVALSGSGSGSVRAQTPPRPRQSVDRTAVVVKLHNSCKKRTMSPPLPGPEVPHTRYTWLLACCTASNTIVALYAFGCVSVLVGTVLLVLNGPAPMSVPGSEEREAWERSDIEDQAFDVPDEYSPDLRYREGTIFGAWWEHLVLGGWICFIVGATINRCKKDAEDAKDADRSDWPHKVKSVATVVAALCFVVSTVIVLMYTGFSGLGIFDVVDEDSSKPHLLEFWSPKCDYVVCWVHEVVGRILVAVVVGAALVLVLALAGLGAAAQEEQKRTNEQRTNHLGI